MLLMWQSRIWNLIRVHLLSTINAHESDAIFRIDYFLHTNQGCTPSKNFNLP
jgi:hypothetical protein